MTQNCLMNVNNPLGFSGSARCIMYKGIVLFISFFYINFLRRLFHKTLITHLIIFQSIGSFPFVDYYNCLEIRQVANNLMHCFGKLLSGLSRL